ncbi:unnamed protein product, partial [Brassica oleracea var. botrytis]
RVKNLKIYTTNRLNSSTADTMSFNYGLVPHISTPDTSNNEPITTKTNNPTFFSLK